MKNVAKFCLILSCVFGFEKIYSGNTLPFFLLRENGTTLEGYFLPPASSSSPIVFAIQGSSCESSLEWHIKLSEQMGLLGLGLIVLEKQGISKDSIDLFEYNQSNCLENRYQDYLSCLENLYAISPAWKGQLVFLGESEGGMLAANLASQTPETAAILLLATGGGMKPSEESKWTIRHRLEEHGALQDQIDEYMTSLDEQMDIMTLDPSPNKHFLGNTYKWWASLLAKSEALISLSELALPIYLVHGVQDDKIPILSADLASNFLKKTNTLTYVRLEEYGHNLNHSQVYTAACSWLQLTLFKQPIENIVQIASLNSSAPSFSEDWKTDISEYVLSRGGEVSAGASASKDSNGNKTASVDVSVSATTDSGFRFDVKGSGQTSQSQNSRPKTEVKVEGKVTHVF